MADTTSIVPVVIGPVMDLVLRDLAKKGDHTYREMISWMYTGTASRLDDEVALHAKRSNKLFHMHGYVHARGRTVGPMSERGYDLFFDVNGVTLLENVEGMRCDHHVPVGIPAAQALACIGRTVSDIFDFGGAMNKFWTGSEIIEARCTMNGHDYLVASVRKHLLEIESSGE